MSRPKGALRRWLGVVTLAAVVVVALVVGGAGRSPSSHSPAARAHAIASELRCPVCQSLSVADSPSETAKAIYDDVRRRIDAGERDSAIRAYYVGRYGQWILLKPESSGMGALVWLLPVTALLLGAGGLALAFRRWRREPARAATDEDRALVEAALGGFRRRNQGDTPCPPGLAGGDPTTMEDR